MLLAVPIARESIDDALADVEEANEIADVIELRIDYLKYINLDTSKQHLDALVAKADKPVVVTVRHHSESGPDQMAGFKGPETSRRSLLHYALSIEPAYVDVEGAARLYPEEFVDLKKEGTNLIVSYHNFDKTPEDLMAIYWRMTSRGGDIVKIAAKAKIIRDMARMGKLLEYARMGDANIKPLIGISMNLNLIPDSSYLVYAALDENRRTAPNQLTVVQVKTWLNQKL